MSRKPKHELFDDLEAFNPRWQTAYVSIREAALAARSLDLYNDWLHTPEGINYLHMLDVTPDYAAEHRIRLAREADSSLPYKLSNIGAVKNVHN